MKKFNFFLLMVFLLLAQSNLLRSATVVDIIVDSPDHETLEAAVIAAGLDDDLAGPGPFTVFAPTDAAFTALPDGVLDALLADPSGDLTDILLYHVLNGSVISGDLSDGMTATTLLGKDIEVTIDGANVYINDALVTGADIHADNGVVHVIDAVLIPPVVTVVDIIVNSPDHETLETAVIAAELTDDLSGEGPFTVFAPTDDAFNALPEDVLDELLADPAGALANVLLYHVVGAESMSGDLSDGQLIETLLGNRIEVSINGDVYINDAMVTVADIEADNGVVHVLDAVLVPSNTVVDIIETSEDHTTLATAIEVAELRDALLGEGPFTVFAPTDDAFNALPEGVLDDLLVDPAGDLADILLYHVKSGNVMSGDLSDGITATTLLGKDIEVAITGDGVFVNDAMVTVADIKVDNGVVHVIDAVLIPPVVTVVDIIANSPDHETLETAVIAAELGDDLSDEGPFTVFAPTDDAFAALPEGVFDDLLADPTGALANVLLYHVVEAEAMSGDLSDGQMISTLFGQDVEVTLDGGVYINDAMVTVADIEADNGVVHVIDAVLVPTVTALGSNPAESNQFRLYPNPASDIIYVSLTETDFAQASIINASGIVVDNFDVSGKEISIDITRFAQGMYHMVISSENGLQTKRFIVR